MHFYSFYFKLTICQLHVAQHYMKMKMCLLNAAWQYTVLLYMCDIAWLKKCQVANIVKTGAFSTQFSQLY